METEQPCRLCGGTFFDLLLQANDRCLASQDVRFRDFLGVIDPQVLTDVSKGEAYDKLHTYASKFRNCKKVPVRGKYIRLGNDKVCSMFLDELKRDAKAPMQRVEAFAKEYLPEAAQAWLVRCLLELIEEDPTIREDEEFFIRPGFQAVKKGDFLKEDAKIHFYDFLLGIWFYVYRNGGDNTVGAETIARWYQKDRPSDAGTFDASAIGISGKYEHIVLLKEESIKDGQDEVVADILARQNLDQWDIVLSPSSTAKVCKKEFDEESERRLQAYLWAAHEKYSNRRTFIYDTERPFADFYVCNDVETVISFEHGRNSDAWIRRIMSYADALQRIDNQNSRKTEIVENITVNDFSTRRSCLIGQGGLGKSMMVNHLFLDAIEHYSDLNVLPFFTTLSDYEPGKRSLHDLIERSVSRFNRKVKREDILSRLDYDLTVVLLDGLDEVKKEYVQECIKEIEYFSDQFPKCRVILSTRYMPDLHGVSGYQPYFLRPFTEKQAFEMIRKLEPDYVDEDIKERFIKDVKGKRFRFNENEKIEFFGNPLFLSIMVLSYCQTNNIPTQRYLFYEQAYQAMASRHDGRKGITRNFFTGFNEREFQKYIGQFCADSYADYNLKFTKELLGQYLDKVIKENQLKTTAEMFIKDITEKLCLVYQDGNEYRFIHRSFQEYFAAYYFTTLMDDEYKDVYEMLKALDSKIISDETISMLCGLDKKRFERYVVLPLLEEIFACQNDEEDYREFLRTYYGEIEYVTGQLDWMNLDNGIKSALYKFVTDFYRIKERISGSDFEDDENWADQSEKYYTVIDYRSNIVGDEETIDQGELYKYMDSNGEPKEGVSIEEEGYFCTIDLAQAVADTEKNDALWKLVFDDFFSLKREFNAAKELMGNLQQKYSGTQTKKRRFGLCR